MIWPGGKARDYEPAHALTGSSAPVPPVADAAPPFPDSDADPPAAVPHRPVPDADPLGAAWTPAQAPSQHLGAYQAWTPPAQPGGYDAWSPVAHPWTTAPTAPTAPPAPTTPTAPSAPAAPAWAGPTDEERAWAPAAHWLPLLTHWIGPLVVLLTVGRRSEWVRAEAVASLNWEITVAVLLAIAAALSRFGVVGPALALATIALSAALHIAGAVTASRGGSFRYPLALPVVR